MKQLDKQDIIDIIYGCTVLGTGGGGALQVGLEILEKDIEEGKKFLLASLDEIPADEYVAVPYVCGSISPLTEAEQEKYRDLPAMEVSEALKAFITLENYFGKPFYGVMATELGGENTADAFHVAAQMGKVIVDADPAGRSVPELQHTTFFINDIPITPMAVSTPFGDTAVINAVVNDFRAETLVRSLAIASRNTVGVADHPLNGRQLKGAVIPGTISYALSIGRTLREARGNGKDAAEEVAKQNNGKILFKGKVKSYTWRDEDGFTLGDVVLSGEEEFKEHEYKVWFKNEHIVSYLDGKIDVTVPDLICILDKQGAPLTNPNYEEGMDLVVFALPAPKEWTTKRGLETFGPRSFGIDWDYKPFYLPR